MASIPLPQIPTVATPLQDAKGGTTQQWWRYWARLGDVPGTPGPAGAAGAAGAPGAAGATQQVSVTDHGATGRGAGHDDTASINAAIVAALASAVTTVAARGHLHFPAPVGGYYLISAALDLTGAQNLWITADPGTEVRYADVADTAHTSWPGFGLDSLFRAVDASNIIVQGLILNGNLNNRTAHAGSESENSCALVAGCAGIAFLNCTFQYGMTDGVCLTYDGSGVGNTNVYLIDCSFLNCRRNNISGVAQDGLWIDGCMIVGAGTVQGISPMAGIDIEPDGLAISRNVHITNNVVRGSAGTFAVSCAGLGTQLLHLAGNTIDGNASYGYNFDSSQSGAPYATGTISPTHGNAVIVGVGTTFTQFHGCNGWITINGYQYQVLQGGFVDATHLTLAVPFAQATTTGLAYFITCAQNTGATLEGGTVSNNGQAGARVVARNLASIKGTVFQWNYLGVQCFASDGLVIDAIFEGNSAGGVSAYTMAGYDTSLGFLDLTVNGTFRNNFNALGLANGAGGYAFQGTPASSTSTLWLDVKILGTNPVSSIAPLPSPQGINLTAACYARGRGVAYGLQNPTTTFGGNGLLGDFHNFDLTGSLAIYADQATSGANFDPSNGGGILRVGGKQIASATVVPASGTWAAGDLVFNSAPSNGSYMGWVCSAAGTPGTWLAMAITATDFNTFCLYVLTQLTPIPTTGGGTGAAYANFAALVNAIAAQLGGFTGTLAAAVAGGKTVVDGIIQP